jgi:hypothetical protein
MFEMSHNHHLHWRSGAGIAGRSMGLFLDALRAKHHKRRRPGQLEHKNSAGGPNVDFGRERARQRGRNWAGWDDHVMGFMKEHFGPERDGDPICAETAYITL